MWTPTIVEMFAYSFALVLGCGLAFGLACVFIVGCFRLCDALNDLRDKLPAVLDRMANRSEIVIEEYDDYSRVTKVVFAYPKPDRVRLARKGEPGKRYWRDNARKLRNAS